MKHTSVEHLLDGAKPIFIGVDLGRSEAVEVSFLVERDKCTKEEAARIGAVKARGAVPRVCGPEIAEAPARGPVRVFMPRQLGKDRDGNFVAFDAGYQGRKAMQLADAFDVMQVQARRRLFTPGQIEVGRDYAALFERYANAGVRCSSLEAMPSGSGGGGGEYIDAVVDQGRRVRAIQSRIGDGLAKEIRRRKFGTDARRAITDRQLVDQVCLAGKTISQVLRSAGWDQIKGGMVAELRRKLCEALERMRE